MRIAATMATVFAVVICTLYILEFQSEGKFLKGFANSITNDGTGEVVAVSSSTLENNSSNNIDHNTSSNAISSIDSGKEGITHTTNEDEESEPPLREKATDAPPKTQDTSHNTSSLATEVVSESPIPEQGNDDQYQVGSSELEKESAQGALEQVDNTTMLTKNASLTKFDVSSSKNTSEYAAWSPLRDKTLWYDPDAQRLWLDETSSSSEKPPAMLLLTSYGWNMENQTEGLQIYRAKRIRELVQAIINHPWFHPTAWDDIVEGRMEIDQDVRYYVFLDRDTCGERNYPRYGYGSVFNADRLHGRDACCGFKQHFGTEIRESRLFQESKRAKFVLIECGGFGPKHQFENIRKMMDEKMVFVSISANQNQLIFGHDMGLPPPACNPCKLTDEERASIMNCSDEDQRTILTSFSGVVSRSRARKDLQTLHNDKDILVGRYKNIGILERFNSTSASHAYRKLATTTSFGAAPLGDNLFSYRFTEVISCGAIPVVYANDWQLPFGFNLLDWREGAVIIRESDAIHSAEILRSIPAAKRCRMRNKALEFYDKYLSTPTKTVNAIIDTLELNFGKRNTSYTGPPIEMKEPDCGNFSDTPLRDKTLCWDPTIERPWLNDSVKQKPPAMLAITYLGWNGDEDWRPKHRQETFQPHNQKDYYRSIRGRELIQGAVNHPWFHPNALDQIGAGNMTWSNETRYYIFIDMETCLEENYPYPGNGTKGNADRENNRTELHDQCALDIALKKLWKVLLPKDGIDWKLVFFDCGRAGPPTNLSRENADPHLAVVSVQVSRKKIIPYLDMGMPAPAVHKHILSDKERADIEACKERSYRLYFSGKIHSAARKDLRRLHDGKSVWIGEPWEMQEWTGKQDPYMDMALQSSFAAIVSGDSVGSSSKRLTEMMSVGAIPVIIADDWVLPFEAIIDWNKTAVIIPEFHVDGTLEVLSEISKAKECSMRKAILEVYEKYFRNGDRVVSGIIDALEAVVTDEKR